MSAPMEPFDVAALLTGPLEAAGLKRYALALGFVAAGIAALGPMPHGDVLDRWLAEGRAGTMRYLHRQAAKRKDPRRIHRLARTAIVVLDNYYDPAPLPAERKVARYARGEDYHCATVRRLEAIVALLRVHGARYARAFADSGPVPERELAQAAGLGWIGKNTMLIRPGLGSWTVIGAVLTDLALPADPPFAADHCGTCTRCLDACPTQAFTAPRSLDATRCLSYLTIEHAGPIPPDLDAERGGWAFGCDVCNEVCPWNERFAEPTRLPEFRARPDPEGGPTGLFEGMDEAAFTARYGDRALARAGVARMRRNWREAGAGGDAGS